MAANTVPERVAWAVEMLGVAPDDRLLEIGCGAGHAVSLICAQLGTGAITAIDRDTEADHREQPRWGWRRLKGKGEPAPPGQPGEARVEKL